MFMYTLPAGLMARYGESFVENEEHDERQTIVAGGLAEEFAASLRMACTTTPARELRDAFTTPEELLDAVEAVGPSGSPLVVMPGAWLRQEGLELLMEVRRLARDASALLVGADLDSLALGQALRLGLRGLVDPAMPSQQLSRAIDVIVAGELWISRQLLIEAVGLLVPPETDAQMDVWLNLPALTQREHDVLMEVLDGKPNKLIARSLDISEQTVKIHLQHIYRKLGVHRRVDLLKAFSESRPVFAAAGG